uniref:Uncharacterized protein n=1 Tax=Mycena chlorophos TaxID=658473 RepID=A0ABQ0LNS2_MYCCL|nr:predicted protein [Mycena chlorophos]
MIRGLPTRVEHPKSDFNTRYNGTRHTNPSTEKDIKTVRDYLEAHTIQTYTPTRSGNHLATPARDLMAAGAKYANGANPFRDYRADRRKARNLGVDESDSALVPRYPAMDLDLPPITTLSDGDDSDDEEELPEEDASEEDELESDDLAMDDEEFPPTMDARAYVSMVSAGLLVNSSQTLTRHSLPHTNFFKNRSSRALQTRFFFPRFTRFIGPLSSSPPSPSPSSLSLPSRTPPSCTSTRCLPSATSTPSESSSASSPTTTTFGIALPTVAGSASSALNERAEGRRRLPQNYADNVPHIAALRIICTTPDTSLRVRLLLLQLPLPPRTDFCVVKCNANTVFRIFDPLISTPLLEALASPLRLQSLVGVYQRDWNVFGLARSDWDEEPQVGHRPFLKLHLPDGECDVGTCVGDFDATCRRRCGHYWNAARDESTNITEGSILGTEGSTPFRHEMALVEINDSQAVCELGHNTLLELERCKELR